MSEEQNLSKALLDAIDTISAKNIDNKKTKTEVAFAFITAIVNLDLNKYKVEYNGNIVEAFAFDSKTTYNINDKVYILIPEGGVSGRKFILGLAEGGSSTEIKEGYTESFYNIKTSNILTMSPGYTKEQTITTEVKDTQISHDVQQQVRTRSTTHIDLSSYFENSFNLFSIVDMKSKGFEDDASKILKRIKKYLKEYDVIILSAKIKTNLPKNQQMLGDYGLRLDIVSKADDGSSITQSYYLNTDTILGDPYSLHYVNAKENTKNLFIKIEKDLLNIDKITNFRLIGYTNDKFPLKNRPDPPSGCKNTWDICDILIKNISIRFAESKSNTSGTQLVLDAEHGNYFDSDSTEAEDLRKKITAHLTVDGQERSLASNNNSFLWFSEDPSIYNTDCANYNALGGLGWRLINGEDKKFIYITKNDVYSSKKYKCVLTIADGEETTNYSDTIEIYDEAELIDIDFKVAKPAAIGEQVVLRVNLNSDNFTTNPTTKNTNRYFADFYLYDSNNVYSRQLQGKYFTDAKKVSDLYVPYLIKKYTISATNKILCALYITSSTDDVTSLRKQLSAAIKEIEADTTKTEKEKETDIKKAKADYNTQISNALGTFAGSKELLVESGRNSHYGLNIIDGNTLYKYDSYGNSPFSKSYSGNYSSTSPNPLSFVILNKDGLDIDSEDEDSASPANYYEDCTAYWYIPNDSLITFNSFKLSNGAVLVKGTDYDVTEKVTLKGHNGTYDKYRIKTIYTESTEAEIEDKEIKFSPDQVKLYYTISNRFNNNNANADIYLTTKFKDSNKEGYTEAANLKFIKDGANGSNGTDTVIVPYWYRAGDENEKHYDLNDVPILTYEGDNVFISENKTYYPSTLENNKRIFFGAEVYKGGELTAASVIVDIPEIKVAVNVVEYDKNNKGLQLINSINPYLTYNSDKGIYQNIKVMVEGKEKNLAYNYVRLSATVDSKKVYAFFPIGYSFITSADSHGYKNDGYSIITYSSSGNNPQYDSSSTNFNFGNTVQYAQAAGGSLSISYNNKKVSLKANAIINSDTTNNNGFTCYFNEKHSEVFRRSIIIRLNAYENAQLNDWDGTSVDINTEGGYIYAPQIGAGKKDSDNKFTGCIMGVEKAGNTTYNGLLGYNKGIRSFYLSARDGSATFGSAEVGQIEIKPGKAAIIKSGDYNEEEGKEKGMQINLTNPSINWGNGKFKVSKDGILSATEVNLTGSITADEGTIGGFTISTDDKTSVEHRWKNSLYAQRTVTTDEGTNYYEFGMNNDHYPFYVARSKDGKWAKDVVNPDNIENIFTVGIDGAVSATNMKAGEWTLAMPGEHPDIGILDRLDSTDNLKKSCAISASGTNAFACTEGTENIMKKGDYHLANCRIAFNGDIFCQKIYIQPEYNADGTLKTAKQVIDGTGIHDF